MASAATVHEGKNLKRIREILGIKQTTLAYETEVSQQTISQLERKKTIDLRTLERVAKVLGVSADTIRNYSDEHTVACLSAFMNNHPVSRVQEPVARPDTKIAELYEQVLSEKTRMISYLFEQLERQKQILENCRCR